MQQNKTLSSRFKMNVRTSGLINPRTVIGTNAGIND